MPISSCEKKGIREGVFITIIAGVILWALGKIVHPIIAQKNYPVFFNVYNYDTSEDDSFIDLNSFDIFVDGQLASDEVKISEGEYYIELNKNKRHLFGLKYNLSRKDNRIFSLEFDNYCSIETLKNIKDSKYTLQNKNSIFHKIINRNTTTKELFFVSPIDKYQILLCKPEIDPTISTETISEHINCDRINANMRDEINKNLNNKMKDGEETFIILPFPNSFIVNLQEEYSINFPDLSIDNRTTNRAYLKKLERLAKMTRSLIVIKPCITKSNEVDFFVEQGYKIFTDIDNFIHKDIFDNLNNFTITTQDSTSIIELISTYILSIYYYNNNNLDKAYETVVDFLRKSTNSEDETDLIPESAESSFGIAAAISYLPEKILVDSNDVKILSKNFVEKGRQLLINEIEINNQIEIDSLSNEAVIDTLLARNTDIDSSNISRVISNVNNLNKVFSANINQNIEIKRRFSNQYDNITESIRALDQLIELQDYTTSITRNRFWISDDKSKKYDLLSNFWERYSGDYIDDLPFFFESIFYLKLQDNTIGGRRLLEGLVGKFFELKEVSERFRSSFLFKRDGNKIMTLASEL